MPAADPPRSVAVTGASGRLGRVLVERLAAEPGIERIVAVDQVDPPAGWPGKVEARRCDVRDPAIAGHLAGCQGLVHLAFVVERGGGDDAEVESINVGGTMNVVGAAAAAGVDRVVHASSIAAYGFHPDQRGRVLDEDQPLRGNPDFYYARTKVECETWLERFAADHPAIAVARLRPSIFLGPGSIARLRLFELPLFPYLAGGERDPVHVTHQDDVAEAFALALLARARGAYNVASDEPVPVADWPHQLGRPGLPVPRAAVQVVDWAYRRGIGGVKPIWFEVGSRGPIVVSSARIRRQLRWQPRWPTTGAVLRALTGRPAAAASRGTRLLFGSMVAITRLRGGLPVDERARAELRAFAGSVNLILTGDRPSEWHVRVRDGVVGVHPGIDPDARSSTLMDETVLFELLAGRLSFARANLTGRIRHRGEGNSSMLIGGVVAGFRAATSASGRAGWPYRAFGRLVMRTGPAVGAEERA